MIQENKNSWHERQETEKLRRLEDEEKDARLTEAGNKKKSFSKKAAAPKKETKLEAARRLEEKKKLEGKLRMRSELWRQRREKDGKLIKVWKEVAKKHQEVATGQQETIQQEDTTWLEDTVWLEELTLTEQERHKLTELETWFSQSYSKTNSDISSIPSGPSDPSSSQESPECDQLPGSLGTPSMDCDQQPAIDFTKTNQTEVSSQQAPLSNREVSCSASSTSHIDVHPSPTYKIIGPVDISPTQEIIGPPDPPRPTDTSIRFTTRTSSPISSHVMTNQVEENTSRTEAEFVTRFEAGTRQDDSTSHPHPTPKQARRQRAQQAQ